MLSSEVETIVTPAIQNKLIVEVEYARDEDGATTCRMMEPFDVAPGRRSKKKEVKFWGWCLFHGRIEQKTPSRISLIRLTTQSFDPSLRERTFSSPSNYLIPRNW